MYYANLRTFSTHKLLPPSIAHCGHRHSRAMQSCAASAVSRAM